MTGKPVFSYLFYITISTEEDLGQRFITDQSTFAVNRFLCKLLIREIAAFYSQFLQNNDEMLKRNLKNM